ncbi:MAG: Glu/Leu/Phe/Val dehydrogenase dimerization domain-containing protein, partial [Chlamydiota bacterium]|nr:Glu/Leu/Phe/Val dehydrogenase dimerization domain-containing protein [Chlamydiota bacterium]
DYEVVVRIADASVGLLGFIAIHSTDLGPGLGGTRIYPYRSEEEALTDVLRLAKGMTYKAAVAQVGLGGAKSVIILPEGGEKSRGLLHAFGRAVHHLKGKYICAQDVGCNPSDIETILEATPYACGVYDLRGGGDPSSFTAWGTYCAIRSTFKELTGSNCIKGKSIVVQGLGNVGGRLLDHLFWSGAQLSIGDIDSEKSRYYAHKYEAKWYPEEEIFDVPCDLFSPNALGGILYSENIDRLDCRAVVGAANNQLLSHEDSDRLHDKGILYAPDFVANAGGLINVVSELEECGYSASKARNMTEQIGESLQHIYFQSKEQGLSTDHIARNLAEGYLNSGYGRRTSPLSFRLDKSL